MESHDSVTTITRRRAHAGSMFFALCALGLAASTSQMEIRGSYPILPDVFVNGKGPFRMLVDTGAQSMSLRPDLAAAAGLRPTFAVELQRVHGTSMVPVAEAYRVSVGSVGFERVEVLIAEPPDVPSLGALDGVVGQSFLSRTNYWMDYGERQIVWDPEGRLANCLDGEFVEFELVDGRPALQAKVAGNRLSLVLDSGASHLILFTGGSGGHDGKQMRVGTLTMGGLRWRELTAGVLPAADRKGGLLPGHLLKSFYVNNRKRYVLVAPRACEPCASGPTGPLAHRAEASGTAW